MNNKVYSKTFLWLFIGLLVTFLTGLYTSTNVDALEVIFKGGTYWIFVVAEVVLAIYLGVRITKMSKTASRIVYLLYAFLTGLTFSSIFIVYKISSIIYVFGISAVLFLIFALIGYKTKLDLRKFGTYLFMMLLGLIICSIINIFIGSESFDLGLAIISIVLFLGYIAYDIKRIEYLNDMVPEDNLPIICAFELYLDFINIFIDLLRLFGNSND